VRIVNNYAIHRTHTRLWMTFLSRNYDVIVSNLINTFLILIL